MNDHDEMTAREHEQVEQRLRSALEARARGSVPDRRLPPPIDWPNERSGRRTWLTPLAIAASVLVIAGGVAVAGTHRTSEAPPATHTSSVTVGPTPSTGASSTDAPSTTTPSTTQAPPPPAGSPTTGTTQTTGTAPAGVRTSIGEASLVVPAGWTVRAETGRPAGVSLAWCLSPVGTSACSMTFAEAPPGRVEGGFDSDIEGGFETNPQYCDPATGYATEKLETYNDLTIGGRAAEYRYWHFVCNAGGLVTDVAQYTVATPTAYVLLSEEATPEIRDLMAGMAASATLPAATSKTRLYDHGVVRTVTPSSGGGWTITLDRVIVGWPNQSATTYSYVLPAAVRMSGPATTAGPVDVPAGELVGRTVRIHTDGQVVTDGFVE